MNLGTKIEPRVEALAEAWASIDGKLEAFRDGRGKSVLEDETGHYAGYTVEAEELIRRLNERGFDVVEKSDGLPKGEPFHDKPPADWPV